MTGPVIDLVDTLGANERACLLRAARRQLRALQAELYRYEGLPAVYALGPTEAVRQELACLGAAVNWLWRQHAT